MVNKIKGEYNAKEENMKNHLNTVQKLVSKIDNFSIESILTEANQLANALSKFTFKGLHPQVQFVETPLCQPSNMEEKSST